MEEQRSTGWAYKLFTICGILLVLIGVAFIFLKEYKDAYTQIITGITFILAGILFKPVIKWKEMPTGMKMLVVYLWFAYFSGLWNVYRKFESFDMLFGIPLQFPISIIVKPLLLIITLILLIAIYRRTWWKLILWLEGLSIVNFLAGSIWFMLTPLTKIFAISGQNSTVAITPQLETITKVITSIPILFGLIIGIIIFMYILKHKDYFQNANN